MKIKRKMILIIISVFFILNIIIYFASKNDLKIYSVIQNRLYQSNHYIEIGALKVYKPDNWLLTYAKDQKNEYELLDLIMFQNINSSIERGSFSILNNSTNIGSIFITRMSDKQLKFYNQILKNPNKYENYYILPISNKIKIISYEIKGSFFYAIIDSMVIINFSNEKLLDEYGACTNCFENIVQRKFP